MTKTFPHKLHFVMMSIIIKFICFFSLLSITATTLNAQYAVRDCKRVAGDALAINDSLVIVYPGGTFINQGEVYYAGVSRLTNHGGFSELVEGPCSAQYSTSCTAPTGTLGQHVFSSRTGHTLIDGTAPLRMRRVVLNRDITLANTWQISDSLIWQDGLITTNRNVPAQRVAFLSGSAVGNAGAERHIDGYASWTGSGGFTLPLGDGQKTGYAGVSGPCVVDVGMAYFHGDPGSASLPAGAPFDVQAVGSGLFAVSDREYWAVTGSDSVQVTVHFDTLSDAELLSGQLYELRVAGWNGSQWEDLGHAGATGSSSGGGTVMSHLFAAGDYSVVTLAAGEGCGAELQQVAGSADQTACTGGAMNDIVWLTTGVNGIAQNGVSGAYGLPAGVMASWTGGRLVISGVSTQTGTFPYNIELEGCPGLSVSGTLTVENDPSLCPCEDVAMILDGDIDGGAYLTSITIVSAGRVSTGSTVYFQAEELITLMPGFTAEVGSAFSARIEQCGSTDPLPLLPEEQEGGEDEENGVVSRTTPLIEPSVEYDGGLVASVWPNPFTGVFFLQVDLPEPASVEVLLQAVQGGLISRLMAGQDLEAGTHRLTINGSDLPAGLYVLTLRAANRQVTHRVVKIQ